MSVVLSSKLHRMSNGTYLHWCPGCQHRHAFYVDTPAPGGARWNFINNDPQRPSFTPSMHIWHEADGDPSDPNDYIPRTTICHYILTDGIIDFLGDCQHELRGMKVELPDMPAWKE